LDSVSDNDFRMLRADVSLLINYTKAITQALGIGHLVRLAEEEHRLATAELSGRSLWHSNGHGDERPTDPAPGFPDE